MLLTGRLSGQTAETPATGTSWAIVALGVTGSALGTIAGDRAGDWASQTFQIDRGVEDPGLTMRVFVGLAGSLAGTMIGTAIGDNVSHRTRVTFISRLWDAGIGMMLGIVAGLVVSQSTEDPRAGVIAFSVTQGLAAGLSNGRW